ncbi:MAG: hypothetical protein RLZZ385_1670 [Pseudomonadota bacterium]|jgi:hypothetical protein
MNISTLDCALNTLMQYAPAALVAKMVKFRLSQLQP